MRRPTLVPALCELERLFDFYNFQFWEGQLRLPLVTVYAGSRSLGHFHEFGITCEGENEHEINIAYETFEYGHEAVCNVMLHEMVHLANFQQGIKDCSDRQYHNKNFKKEAERVGLIVTQRKGLGFATTELGKELKVLLKDEGFNKFSFKLVDYR